MGRAPEKKRGDGRKENAGRSISRDIVRLIEAMTTPWDQKSIPRMLRGTQFKQGVLQSKKRQVQTFLIVHTSSI